MDAEGTMMGDATTSVTSGHCARFLSCPSGRSYLTAGGAFVGAGILALGLVGAPPDSRGPRTEIRSVQLTALTLPPAPHWIALEKFISNPTRTVVRVAPAIKGGASNITTAVVSTIDPATERQQVNTAALA